MESPNIEIDPPMFEESIGQRPIRLCDAGHQYQSLRENPCQFDFQVIRHIRNANWISQKQVPTLRDIPYHWRQQQ
ncbi:MAG: hypothetical protein EON54_12830 [Alcaligenaceae bacterium]|nr:MAG: hypothetical protein EON54_12830 [Alcaligenaceae bacterium]